MTKKHKKYKFKKSNYPNKKIKIKYQNQNTKKN